MNFWFAENEIYRLRKPTSLTLMSLCKNSVKWYEADKYHFVYSQGGE